MNREALWEANVKDDKSFPKVLVHMCFCLCVFIFEFCKIASLFYDSSLNTLKL